MVIVDTYWNENKLYMLYFSTIINKICMLYCSIIIGPLHPGGPTLPAIRGASMFTFSVFVFVCLYVTFFVPTFNQPIIDRFKLLRFLQQSFDKMFKSIMSKLSKNLKSH